jgi:ribosomal protein S11
MELKKQTKKNYEFKKPKEKNFKFDPFFYKKKKKFKQKLKVKKLKKIRRKRLKSLKNLYKLNLFLYSNLGNLKLKTRKKKRKLILKLRKVKLPNFKKDFYNFGLLRIFYKKRNIFICLTDVSGKILSSTSYGSLGLKKRKYMPAYLVLKTAKKIINKLLKIKIRKFRQLILIFKGRAHRKVKKTLIKPFKKNNKLKVLKLIKLPLKSHNGCRPRKERRK